MKNLNLVVEACRRKPDAVSGSGIKVLRHIPYAGHVQAQPLIHDCQTQPLTEMGNRAAQQRPAFQLLLIKHAALELAPLARDQGSHVEVLDPLEQNLWIDPVTQ
ncbi:hypothetical protein D3C77_708330 [compost metagenome]